jgi:putative transposase
MKSLYEFLGISKQAHWKYMQNYQIYLQDKDILTRSLIHLRQLHPKMGAKKMYTLLMPEFIGRDAFIELYSDIGLKLKQERSYTRTTFSTPGAKYKNLTINKIFTDINELWSSDITYFSIGLESFLYITFIIDVYSRKIIGFHASPDLSAKACVTALEMALKTRKIAIYEDLIHHSDKGTQYTSLAYTQLLSKHNIKISNGIIKNEYLAHMHIKSLAECQRTLAKAVHLYNTVRPHWGIGGISPHAFESNLKNVSFSQRIHLKIYHDENKINCHNVKQFKIQF